MKVKDVMTPRCECVDPDTTLEKAAQRMQELDVGPLPVCDHDRLAGIVTDRDIVIRAVADGRDPHTTRVRDIMTPGISYCFEDDDVASAAETMKDKQIRRLVVLNGDKRLVGIVSLGDLAVVTNDQPLAGETLRRISEPSLQAEEIPLATPY
jgi:CBS domain-containing protein